MAILKVDSIELKDESSALTPALFRRASRAIADAAAYGYASHVLRGYSIDLIPDALIVTLNTVDGEKFIVKNFAASYDLLSMISKGGAISIETLFLIELGRLLPREGS